MACAPAAGGSAASARQSARHRLRRAIGVVMGNSRQWWWRSGGLAAEIEAFLARRAAGDAFHDLAPAIHLDDLVEASALLAGLGVGVRGRRHREVAAGVLVVPTHRPTPWRRIDRLGEPLPVGVVHVLADHAPHHAAEQDADRGAAGAVVADLVAGDAAEQAADGGAPVALLH